VVIRHRVNSYAARNYKSKDTVVFVQYNFGPNRGMGLSLELSSGYGNRPNKWGQSLAGYIIRRISLARSSEII